MKSHHQKWKLLAPLGLLTTGLGISLLGEAGLLKSKGRPFWHWFGLGTVGITCFNAGLSMFGDSVKERTLYELDGE